MKKISVFLSLLLLTIACSKSDKKLETDFENLMGKNLPSWQYVQTKEDKENLKFFKTIFDANQPLLAQPSKQGHIPKLIHFIWIGPKPFPRESVENVKSWIAKHPDWTVKFWTDRERPLPHPSMQKARVQDLNFTKLANCYHKSDNYGEKSDLLRYEILYQEGGVYVDHDVKCVKSFAPLHHTYDLFCGLEMPSNTPLSSSVFPTNNIVAARAQHPVLKHCLEWIVQKWDQIERDYPGKDRDAVINRVSHRTFSAFGESVRTLANRDGNRDIVFPAFYFNAPKDELAIYSRHLYAGTWFENETQFEKMVRERLVKITKKTNQLVLFFGFYALLTTTAVVILYSLYRKRRKA